MTEARGDFRRSAGVLCAMASLATAAGSPGCSRAEETPGRTSASSTGGTEAGTSAGSGTGGEGGTGGGGSYVIAPLAPALPFDATPDPGGAHVYFTGVDEHGTAGVFKARLHGEARSTEVAVGAPFVAPLGIATSTDGGRLFVADPGAGSAPLADAGGLFAIDLAGGAVAPVPGGEGLHARGLEVARGPSGEDQIVVAGRDPEDGQPGVFALPARGGVAAAIAKGSPLVDPSGVAVAGDGDVFICDTLASPDRTATIFRIEDGFVSPVVAGLHVGYPCGIALTLDGAALLVLTRDVVRGAGEIARIELSSGARSRIDAGAAGRDEPGGMHRAKGADVFAFADRDAQGKGSVFLLRR
ncbi:uncharacterized protein SOCE26_086340 [Sorangium cellulosum]|uniref:Uncharacterized protein n=1 Tax=Sorangium cellulosum TaxID=56 RepID=A0A2L0F6G9_SORCE|nr:hypothetical protein [Sorangium cellulosum]AUX47122.1 uncharacterized protein SOCE26_086340 [Sorangium cellulosum]